MKGFKGMKLLKSFLSMMLILGFGSSIVIAVDVPMTVSYQCNLASSNAGELTESSKVNMTFYLYASDESTIIWSEPRNNLDVVNGIVSVVLGESGNLTEAHIDGAEYIGVSVNGGAVMEPKTKLTSAMYAIRAKYADHFTPGVPAFDDSNLSPGIISGTALAEDSITSIAIKDGSITSEDLADNAINSRKITTSFTAVSEEDITTINKDYHLTKEDQGIIFVEGAVNIILDEPGQDNIGERYTIKKIDDGLQRPCKESCKILTNVVTIKCGAHTDNIKETMKIEGRTNEIYLEFKNSYVTLISNGLFWYIIDSNPPQDIYAPVPGNFGNMAEDIELLANTPVQLTFTKATDCDLRRCDTCEEELEYMIYYSTGDKLTSLDIIRDKGFPCKNTWFTDEEEIIIAECDTSVAETPYTGPFKVNVVVRDKYGNMAAYCPPGDNTPPEADIDFWVNPTSSKANLLWNRASDNKTDDDKLTYTIYYSKVESVCVQDLDQNEPDTDPNSCNVQIPIKDAVPSGTWDSSVRGTNPQLTSGGTQCIVDLLDLTTGTYYFTIVVEDEAANRLQYSIVETYIP